MKLGKVMLHLKTGSFSLASVSQNFDLHFPVQLMNLDVTAWQYNGVISQKLQLVNAGDTVKAKASENKEVSMA